MIIAEIGINHLGKLSIFKKYIKYLNKTDVEGITIQLLKKNFFTGNFKNFYINRNILLKIFIKLCKKKVGLVTDCVDKLILKNRSNIDFFKVLGGQFNNVKLIRELNKIGKPVYFSNRGLKENDEKKLINFIKDKKNCQIIHTQLKTSRRFSNLKNITKLKKILNDKVSFGSHCDDQNIIFNSLKFKPKKIFFYIKDNKDLDYPDKSYAIPLNKIKRLLKGLK